MCAVPGGRCLGGLEGHLGRLSAVGAEHARVLRILKGCVRGVILREVYAAVDGVALADERILRFVSGLVHVLDLRNVVDRCGVGLLLN